MPRRHQRPKMGNLAGWRKPAGAVLICRPYRWGNPYTVAEYGRHGAVELYERDLIAGQLVTAPGREPLGIPDARRDLAGRDVVCACKLSERCHGDVLLRWANSDSAPEVLHRRAAEVDEDTNERGAA